MKSKLTLSLNHRTIEKAKDYARLNKISLSKMIESYLENLTNQSNEDQQITPLVKSLSGIIDLPADYDYKKEYGSFLTEKYQ
ncbi:MAG: DUF6364 family protein [Bacteroidales bacterium]